MLVRGAECEILLLSARQANITTLPPPPLHHNFSPLQRTWSSSRPLPGPADLSAGGSDCWPGQRELGDPRGA